MRIVVPALLVVFIGSWQLCIAQVPVKGDKSFHLSYLANNALYPGLNGGFEYVFASKVKLHTRSRPGKGGEQQVKLHQLVGAVNLGAVWHPRTSTSLIHSYTVEYRKTGPRRMQFQFGLGPAYFRTFLPKVYEVDESGNAERRYLAGRGYFAPQVFIGYGRYRTFSRTLQWWHIRIVENTLIDYNNALLPYLMLELRLGFHKKPPGE